MSYGMAGNEDAPVLLLLHAIRNTRMLFAGIVPALAEHYRVVAVDLRGHGQSTDAASYTFADIVEDLSGLLDAEGLEQVTVVAASFSAVPAQMLAVREPRRVTGLVLLDGGFYRLADMPGFELESSVERLAAARFSSVEEAESQFARRYGDGQLPPGWIATELERKEDGKYGYRLPREAFSAFFREYSAFPKEELFRSLSCPVRLLLADEKELPDDVQRGFFRQAAADYARLVPHAVIRTIPDSLHLLMVTNPDDIVEEIKKVWNK